MPYSPTVWVDDATPALNETNLDKIEAELDSAAAAVGVTYNPTNWIQGSAPYITDAAPLNNIEAGLAAVASAKGLSYTQTVWAKGWNPARNAFRLNKIEQQLVANREAIEEFPASFYTGPAGVNNILPPTSTGTFVGLWSHTDPYSWANIQSLIQSRETAMGRMMDFIHLNSPSPLNGYYFSDSKPFSLGHEQWVHDRGQHVMLTWSPKFTLANINAGNADTGITEVADLAAAYGLPVWIRLFHEFNGNWFTWQGTGQPFIDAWRRVVDIFVTRGATNVCWLWCPDEGDFAGTDASYPGDAYVDWVGSDKYNWYNANNWLLFTPLFRDGQPIHDNFAQKPFCAAEFGSNPDPVLSTRKPDWILNAQSSIKSSFSNLYAASYFDFNADEQEWDLVTPDTQPLTAWTTLVNDAHFNTQGL